MFIAKISLHIIVFCRTFPLIPYMIHLTYTSDKAVNKRETKQYMFYSVVVTIVTRHIY